MTFDKLTFDRENGRFQTTIHQDDKQFGFTIYDLNESQSAYANNLTTNIGNWLTTNIENIKQYAAAELIDIKNEDWNEDGEITEEDFSDALELSFITVNSQGDFQVYFDSELFEGDFITVDINKHFGLINAEVER